MSNTPHRIAARHSLGCASIHALTFAAVRDSTTSTSFARRPRPPTSTTDVAHSWVLHSPRRTNNVSSNPPTPRPARPGRRQRRGAPRRARRPRRTPCASHSRARRRPRSPTARTSRPAVSPTAPPDPSTPPAARDPRIAHRPRPHRAPLFPAPPPRLAPHQPGRPTETRQIHELDDRAVLHHRPAPALPTPPPDPPATRRPPGSGRPQRRRPREQTPPASPQAAHTCA